MTKHKYSGFGADGYSSFHFVLSVLGSLVLNVQVYELLFNWWVQTIFEVMDFGKHPHGWVRCEKCAGVSSQIVSVNKHVFLNFSLNIYKILFYVQLKITLQSKMNKT